MPATLLRPYVLSFKNKVLGRSGRQRYWHRDILVLAISILMMIAIFQALSGFLIGLKANENYGAYLPAKLISLTLLSFFFLLLFSNIIAALSFFYHAKDIPLLLVLPISSLKLYLGRLLVTSINSSWVFALFAFPAVFAYQTAFDLPWTFAATAILAAIPFVLIPAAIGSIIVTLVVNVIPTERLQEIIVVISLFGALSLIALSQQLPVDLTAEGKRLQDMATFLALVDDPHPEWLPSKWVAELLMAFFGPADGKGSVAAILLATTLLGTLALGYLTFDTMYLRGWTRSFFGAARAQKVHASNISVRLGRVIVPFNSQFRSVLYKDLRMFIRDPTQCVQFLLLLMLTFVYLYNFRALRVVSGASTEAYSWWQTVLCVANVSLGGCVVSAISTRFVFPAVSLEGRAYWIMRSAPMTIRQLLRYKFMMWFLPVAFVSTVLLISGAWTIGVSPETVLLCGAMAIALSIGIVGLGIGVGCVYASFDWETPTQVAASFGSLVFMLLSLAVIMITLIPASLLIILFSVPAFSGQMHQRDYLIAVACASFLVVFINFVAARWALSAGLQALEQLEA